MFLGAEFGEVEALVQDTVNYLHFIDKKLVWFVAFNCDFHYDICYEIKKKVYKQLNIDKEHTQKEKKGYLFLPFWDKARRVT